jgi:PilZ domain
MSSRPDESLSRHIVIFCEPPPFDKEELRDEEFLFIVCSGRSEFLCCQLLPYDVIVMSVGHANSEHARSCAGLQPRQQLPLLIVMADEPTAVPGYLHPDAIVPERATASEVMAVLRRLPWRPPSSGAPPRTWPQRRRFPRYRTDLPLTVCNGQELGGRCLVIAEGGIGGILPEAIPVGCVAHLRLSLPTHPTLLEVWAVVRCQLHLHHGFEFVSLTDGERLSVKQFCNELATQSASE